MRTARLSAGFANLPIVAAGMIERPALNPISIGLNVARLPCAFSTPCAAASPMAAAAAIAFGFFVTDAIAVGTIRIAAGIASLSAFFPVPSSRSMKSSGRPNIGFPSASSMSAAP